MTDKELQKLKRSELLEIMLGLQNELDWLKKENKDLKEQIDNKRIALEKSGSIAQAALEVTGIFESAQKAADVYLENVRAMHEDVEKKYNEQLSKAKIEAENLLNKAKIEAENLLNKAKKDVEEMAMKSEAESRAKLRVVEEECSRRINETNSLCTKKIKETQEKCQAISTLDSKISAFFSDNSPSGAALSGGNQGGVQNSGI